ncbi:hypothetical protein [Bradyrhizobium hereditatis]|uniref:hypothetical protein n=1 Tax=Bradyrhizobium hereditatis TaxID=2821405 RepID=UPI001CE31EB3|nr:hypothetical protein [Bradyrhizobium hereditatis]
MAESGTTINVPLFRRPHCSQVHQPAFVTFGRVLFALLFIYTRATKLFGIQQTADLIATKFSVPEAFALYIAPRESATGRRRNFWRLWSIRSNSSRR